MIPYPLARADVADQHLRWLVEQAQARVERAFPQRVALLLLGSLARGEGTVLVRGSRPVVLSDLDLAVVFGTPRESAEAAGGLQELARSLLRAGRAWGLWGAVDIGSYALRDLARPGARPGTRELKRRGAVLAGDPDVLAAMPEIPARSIPPEEALLLCENRMLELLWAHPALAQEPPAPFAAAYAGGKAVLDGTLAWLVRHGECPDGVEERLAAAQTWLAPVAEDASVRDLLEALRFWTRFKLDPLEEDLAARYGMEAGPGAVADGCGRAWREGARLLLDIYRSLVEETAGRGRRREARSGPGVWRLAASRARRRRRYRRWLEAWRRRRQPGMEWATTGRLFGRAGRGTPEHLLGATAAALVACAPGMEGSDRERGRAARFARRTTPITWPRAAGWETQRDALVSAWDRWVLRGARTASGDGLWLDR